MSLKNNVKVEEFVYQLEHEGRVITVVGNLLQTAMKRHTMLANVLTTPGGNVLDVEPLETVDDGFDSQPGIRKEFYMGWSICAPEDTQKYDIEYAKTLARKRFSRPLVTYNFTYLNNDMIMALLRNEAEYIAANLNKYTKGQYSATVVPPLRKKAAVPTNHHNTNTDTSAAQDFSSVLAHHFVNGTKVSEDEFNAAVAELMNNPIFKMFATFVK